ncbi:leukotoxin LktA family filamentous adhesin [Dialister sp. i34-0019-2H8]|uniref:leukotoxin LktA family filamentous adhesin n=1 Tax=Dialister sp. i34-0019-2H8 TaxID=3141190 RepID=UPI0036F1B515
MTDIANSGKQYDITNQQVKDGNALNKFNDFGIKQHDVANLHMEKANHQINVVKNKIDIDGVVNAIKDNKIGGDVYFFSNAGIAVGSHGVFNVGRLTLGTNTAVGDALYNGYYVMPPQPGPVQVNFDRDKDFYQKSPAERARLLNDGSLWGGNTAGDAGISFAGKINAKDSVVIASAKSTISQTDGMIQTGAAFHDYTAGQSADTYRNSLVNTAGIVDATTAVATMDGIALIAKKNITLAGEVASHGRSVTVETGDNLVVTGTEAKASRITSGGGAIALTASSQDAKLQADPGKEPGDGMISIKDAYIDSSSEKKDSGKIDITAVRNVMGVSRIDVDDATITAEGKNGHKAGDVSIHATAATKLYAWDIGDGAYALVKMGQKSRGRNTIKGDNVDISARATTSGVIGDDNELSDAEIKAGIEREKDHNAVLGLIEEYGGNFRTFGSATKTYAEANVDIDKTDIKALGDGTGAEGHGDVKITSDAKSDIAPFNVNLVGIGFNVGIGDVKSYVDVDDSTITSAKDTTLSAEGTNAVKMSLIDFSAVPMGGLSLDFSWAQLTSDIAAKVGKKATLTSQGDVDISAKSIRSLGSGASNCGQTLGLAVGLGISDTKASADMAGKVYAKGDVSVKAENTLSENGGVYAADTVTASSIGGDTALKPTTDPIKAGVGKFFSKLKKAFTEEDKTGQAAKDLDLDKADKPAKQKKPWNKMGANASTALLFSDNDATASVTGKVRGIDASGNASDAAGAKSLTVDALTLSRSHAVVGSYQNDTTSKDETTKKDNTITAAISYLEQRNHATAFISGDTKTSGDTTVHAKTVIPWQTSWQSSDPVDQLLNVFFNSIDTNPVLPDLVDSWTQAAGNGDNVNGAASVSIVNYDNNAKAYIGKKDDTQTTTPAVDAAGNVNVTGETDITTVNLTGTIQSYLSAAPLNLWKTAYKDKDKKLAFQDIFNRNGWTMEGASKAGVGGAALSVHQKNNAEAYIDDGAVVTAKGSADVNAKARALNIAMAAAGGPAKSVAVDATVGVNRFDNTTKARIGEATVTAKDVSVTAEDLSKTIQAAGAIGVSGGTGIGASIAYNHINRDTEAAISGNVTADDNVNVSAKNTGEIIAASVAGAVAYDNKRPNVKNKAGSTGFHAVEDGDEDGIELEDFVNDMDDADENTPLLSQETDRHIGGVASKDGAMKDNVAEAKGGLAAAANVSVNRITDTAKATVAKQDGGTAPSVTADALRVNGLNDSAIRATSAAIGANLHANAGTALAGSFMYNSITADNEAYVDGATLTLSGNEGKDKDGKDIDESLTVRAENDATILNIAASGSGATKGFSGAGQISLNWVDDKTDAHVKDSTVKAKEATTIEAKDKGKIDSYTGAVSVSTHSSAVGAAIGANLIEGDTKAYLENSEVAGTAEGEKAGKLAVTSDEASQITSIIASGALADKAATAFSASGNWIHTTTDAHVDSGKAMKTGAITIDAGNHSNATLGVGTGAISNTAVGASVAVMVNDSDVKASLSGDAKKEKTIEADGISVKADNAYNGSAKDSDSDSTAKTVAVGFAAGAAKFAGSGSVTVNVISQKADASIGKGNYQAGNQGVDVEAKNTARLFGLAGGLGINLGGTGIGAAADVQTYKGHTYASIEDGAKLSKASSVRVNAESEEDLTSVAATIATGDTFAGAGAAGLHVISTDTKAYIGNQEDKDVTDAGKAELIEAGAVSVTAKDTTKLTTSGGSGAVSGTAAGGLSAAVEVVQKKASAYVGNHASIGGESLTVQAENTSDSKTAAAGLGVGGTAGVAGAASETFVTHTTDAHVGRAANVTTSGDADVKAVSSFKQGAGAGGVGGSGTVGIGLANATVSLSADTKAHVDTGAKVTGKNVRVAADHTTDITYATIAGGIAGTAAINGAVGVNVLDTKTKAYTEDKTELTATGTADTDGIAITASDATKLHGGNGGASVGFAGGGAGLALSVMNLTKDTEAYAGKAAKLDAKGQISLDAQSSEDIFNLSLQAAGGSYAGLAGATNVMNLTAITKAYTDTGVEINQKAGYGKDDSKDVSLTATHEVKEMKNTVTAASGSGGASVGAAVDVGNIKTQTNAFLGDGNKVASGGSVTVEAKDNMHDIMSNAISAAIGFVGLSGSISVYNVGSTMSPEDQKTLSGQTSENGETVGFDSWVNEELAKINEGTGKAVGAYDTASLDEVKSSLGKTFASEAPSSAGEKGTLAKIGNGTAIDAAGDVKVHADDTLSMQNIMGSLSGSAAASAGASVSVLNTDTQTKALVDKAAKVTAGKDLAISAKAAHNFKEYITGASVSGGVAGQGTVGTWTDKSAVSALLGDTNAVHAKNISITSDNDRTLDAYVAGASVALCALNGAVVTANVTGSSEAGIGDDEGKYAGEVKADEALTVSSNAKTTMDAKAFGAAAGIFGGTGTGADLSSAVDVTTKVGKKAKLSGKTISLTAENTPKMSALATSAGVGIGGVGATVAVIDSKDTSRVTIADGASLTAVDKLIARAAMSMPTDDYNAYAHAIAGSGGVIAGSVAVVGIGMKNTTETAIGKDVKIKAGRAEITADHKDRGNYEIESIAAGGYSGTGADTRYTVDSTSKVTVGDGTTVTTDRETAIRADNVSEKAWKDGSEKENATSGGAALDSGNGVVSVTKITHTTEANLGKVTLQASASDLTAEEKAAGKTLHDKKAITIDAASRVKAHDNNALSTGAAVGAAHVKETLDVKATTSATVSGGASLKAGETEKANAKDKAWEGKAETASYDGSYKGGTIAIGTRNDADLYSTTLVDVFGLAGYAGSENDVTYTGKTKTTFGAAAETAKGDISLAAGRDSAGETGTISVSAHSDILNATAIPISIQKDPYAKADSQASLTVTNGADMKSDRDILLKAKAGAVSAFGNGEVKDWVNAIEDAFGSDGSQIGKKEIAKSADVTMNGKAETGIHRKKSMTIGGTNKDGTWTTKVTSDGDLSYTYGGSKPAGSELYDQLHELQGKLIDYAADPSAKAAYEAEITFLEQKMAAEGLGYFDKSGRFVETPPSSTSELDSAKAMRDQANALLPEIKDAYEEKIKETQDQIDGLDAIAKSKNSYDSAAASAVDAESALTAAKSAEETAKTTLESSRSAVETLATDAGQPLEEYVAANPNEERVVAYTGAKKAYDEAQAATKVADLDKTAADTAKSDAETAYTSAVSSYNTAYSDSIPTDPKQYDEMDISKKQTALTNQKTQQEKAKDVRVGNYNKINTQIELTEEFFAQKGTEKGGKFFDANGNEVEGGKVKKDGKEYYLLHSLTYPQMTHDFLVGDVTSQLGDIVFEGDNVSGAGTLKAGGDAEVKITNDSPNNLVMGDIHVVGSQGTAGAGQGGTIYFNSTEIKGDSAEAVQKAIQKENKDKTRSVSFAAETRYQTGGPSVTIENNFRPQAYVDSDNAPYYAAPNVDLKGYIYNPRGTVTVTSANGDVYNKGTIYAGSVNMTATNGDFIQTYDASSAGTRSGISSVGGNPLDDTGNLHNVDKDGKANDKLGSGILANGNVFISARYVNINSKIQSGVPDHAITIPKEYKLFYMDGSTKVDVTDAGQAPSGAKILASDKDGKEIEGVSYDRTNDRFVISDVEVHGGHVSIVGTILNTTNDTNKARIEALDGYGTIQVKNDSDKNIELKTLSTGGGIEGKIEITDLDRLSGKVTRKTTYTRKNGVIQQSVQSYANGNPTGDPAIFTFTNAKDAKYHTTKGSYYTVQTGQDSSTTTTYELHDTRLDWWGIDDKAPTSAEMLAQGGTVTDFWKGDERTLEGGAFVSDYNTVDGTTASGNYVTTDKQFTSAEPTSTFTKKEERLWYTLGLAKKFDYKLVETTYDTKVTQYSLKSDYDVGIGFGGLENGGTLTVDGGSHDVLINGTLSNGRGASTLSGGSLTQGDLGYVDTGSLHMTATGSIGSAGQAIKTSADTVSGSAGGDFAVNVKGNVTLGAVSAGKIADITAEDGITQAAGEALSASRVNLDAGSGAIRGASGALSIQTKQGSGEAYGLKAVADGNIAITNTGGDLYLDSVTSKRGDVILTTDGSFIDNNFTDVANENAKAKLDAWSKARVLEGSEATISKQKSLLIAKVQGKYNEYQTLSAYVKDGTYTLDDTAKAALANNGVTDIDAYIAEKQARYDELAQTVGTWKKTDVEAYVKVIEESTDKTLYGNAALTAKDLTSDDYLTAEEKKEVLVGSAKAAQDLLVTFSGGSIKEGITDTQTTQKETAHVTGQNVTLTALGGKTENGKYVSGIGRKESGQVIDLSTKEKIESLTADQLIALASAERGDFKVDGKTVTVSSIRSIETNADGKLTAKAENGAVYLTSDTGVKEGSELLSGGELRMKGTGDLKNVTVGAKDQIVLESGEGKISGVTIQRGGTLTARAKKGVSLSKDGDLVINTVYASDGDVALDLKGHSLLAEDGHDADKKTGTTYTNVEGENISIENVANVKGEGEGQSLGMKVTGKKAEDGSMVPGSIRFQAAGDADITLFGEAASDATSIEAENTAITNHGKISDGSYKARKALRVYHAKDGTISGGTFTGADTTLTNQADLSGAKVEGTKTLTVTNTASIQNATLTGGAATVDNHGEDSVMKDVTLTGSAITLTNEGTVENGSYTAETGAMTVKNNGKLSSGTYTAKGTMDITNEGTVENGSYTAETGAMTVKNSGKLSAGAYTAKAGTMGITNRKTIENATFTAGGALTYDGNADSTVTETTMTGASVDITNVGTLTNGSYTAETGAMTVKNNGKLSSGTYTAKETMGITNQGTIENGEYTARGDLTYTDTAEASLKDGTLISKEGKAKITAHGVFQSKKLSAKDNATVEADYDVTLNEAEAGTLAVSSGGSVNAGTLTATTGDAEVKAKTDVKIGTLKAETGSTTIEATDGKLDVTTLNAKSLTAKAGTTLSAKTLDVKEHAELTSGSDMVLTEAHANALTANAGGKLTATTLGVTGAAGLTSGGAMEVTEANVGSVMANAGSTLHVKKLTSTGEATLTSKDEAKLDDVTGGTLAAESTAGSVNAGTLTAKTGNASVTAKTDVKIDALKAEAGGATIEATEGKLDVTTLNAKSVSTKAGTTLSAKTLDVKEHAELSSGGAMTLESASADTLTANAGTTLNATKIHTASDAGLVSGSDMVLHEAEAGGKLMASAGGSISVKETDAKISGSTIEMTAKEDIRITDRSPVGKLDGVDTSVPAGSTTGSGAAGSLVTGEAKPHDFDASGKGSALLSSAGGKVTLSAKKVEIDTLANGKGDAADLTISADNIGIDDLAGTGAQHVTIHGKDGQSQAHYAGIHSTAEGGTLVKDSAVEHLHLTGREPLGLSNTAIGGDSLLATDKIRVTIQKNPGSSQAEHFGNLSLSGYDIATDHVMTSVKDGLTVNGERFPVTAENVMNASLYEDRTLGRDGREKEEETEKESPSLAFGAPNDKEAYEVVK